MKAVVIDERGGPDVLHLASLPDPTPGPGQVRLRVAAAAVNPVDLKTRSGFLADIKLSYPAVLGWDVSGVVDQVGADVADWAVGDEAIAMVAQPVRQSGTYAEFVVVNGDLLAAAPESVPLSDAAAFPLASLTAWQALDMVGVESGEILVTGAVGAVGGFAVQLAKSRGLRVVALVGAQDAELARELGADEVILRGAALPKGSVDGVLDTAGVAATIGCVRDAGTYVSIEDAPLPAPERDVIPRKSYVDESGVRLSAISGLVDSGVLRGRIADSYPLQDARVAHKRFEAGGVRGKLLLRP